MKNILVPCDFSIPALEAYQFAEDIAARSAAEVHLLKVIDLPFTYEPSIGMPPYYLNTQVLKEIEEDTTRELEKVKISYPGQGNVHVAAQSGPVTHTILQFIRDHAIDLVVMGTRGSGGLKEYLIGSNTEKIMSVRITGPGS